MASKIMGIGYLIIAGLFFFAATDPKYFPWGIIFGVAALILAIYNLISK